MIQIPFNKPHTTGKEQTYIAEAIDLLHISGDGEFTKRCSELIEQVLGVKRCLLTTSCTHALEMAAILLNIEPGDEIIAPSFTFVSTLNAFVLRGAKPIFVDVRDDTLNLDERKIEAKVTARTKAILPVHYAGISCAMDQIMEISAKHGVPVVEDNAHGLFGKYRGRQLGTFGTFATQSFHETKNLQCGEGGALLINDGRYVERAEIVREKGTDRSRFFRGQVDKYTWVDVGSSYLPSDILAAFLFAQLEQRLAIQSARQKIWQYYYEHLADWASSNKVRLPIIPEECEQSYHMFYMLLPSLASRQGLIHHLKQRGIDAVYHYLPLHISRMGAEFGGKHGDCPVTESVSDRLIRLPFFVSLTPAQQRIVVDAVKDYSVPVESDRSQTETICTV